MVARRNNTQVSRKLKISEGKSISMAKCVLSNNRDFVVIIHNRV